MKDFITAVPVEEMYNVVKKCLEKAALINYTKISETAKIEGSVKWTCNQFVSNSEIYKCGFLSR
jgi:protein-arginine kinase activator protein McsA